MCHAQYFSATCRPLQVYCFYDEKEIDCFRPRADNVRVEPVYERSQAIDSLALLVSDNRDAPAVLLTGPSRACD